MEQHQLKAKNPHVQITRSLLRAFSERTEDGKQVWYLDFSDWQIKQAKINELGTKPFYYSQVMEDFLSKYVENKVGDLFAKLRGLSKSGNLNSFKLKDQDIKNIRIFFAYCLLRGDSIRASANKHSVFAQFIEGGYTTENMLCIPHPAVDYFSHYNPVIFLNQTTTQLLIPYCCIYTAPLYLFPSKHPRWILPISPKCAVVLVHKDDLDDHSSSYYKIDDLHILKSLNIHALHVENRSSNNFIVSSERELTDIQQAILHDEKLRRTLNIQIPSSD